MDVVCDGNAAAIGLCGVKKLGGTDGHVTALLPNGSVNHITEDQTNESSISCDVSTRIDLTEDVSANESSCLLIHPDEESTLAEETAFPHPEVSADGAPTSQLPNGLPVCAPPSAVRPLTPPLQFSAHKPDTRQHHPASAANSPNSLKSSSRAVANDLCASVALACLFCQVCDCLLVTVDGCALCSSLLCPSLCYSDPRPGCTCQRGCPCRGLPVDFSSLDSCFRPIDCLELALEISQLIFH